MEIYWAMNNVQPAVSAHQQTKSAHRESPKHLDGDSPGNQQSTETAKSSVTIPLISNQFNKIKKPTGQRQKNIKSTKDVDLPAKQQCINTTTSAESVTNVANHPKKRKTPTGQKQKNIKSTKDVNLPAKQQCINTTTSAESVTTIANHFKKRKTPTGQKQKNIKSTKDVNLPAKQQCINTTTSAESDTTVANHFKKRKTPTGHKQKSIGGKLHVKSTEIPSEPKLDESDRKLIWDLLDRSFMLNSVQSSELDKSILENVTLEKGEASVAEVPQLNGSGISLTKETSPTNVDNLSSSCELDESNLKKVSSEKGEASVTEVPQLNVSEISLTKETSPMNVDSLSSTCDFDESILKTVSLEKGEVSVAAVPKFSGSEKSWTEEITPRNIHSLSSSYEDSSINTEHNSPDIINSITEDNYNDILRGTSALESSLKENDGVISNESSIIPAVEINKKSDVVRTQQAPSYSTEAKASNLDEIKLWVKSPTNVDSLSSSCELDESILKTVSLEKGEVSVAAVPKFSGSGKSWTVEITPKNIHSLSSSYEDSSINTEQDSPDIINSIIEDNYNDILSGTSALESSSKESDGIISNESSIIPTVEINKKSDVVKTQQALSYSTEDKALKLDEINLWECEELEESFSDIVDDLEKCMKSDSQEPQLNNDQSSENCDSTIISSTKMQVGQITNPQLTTPKKRKPQSNENHDAVSPTKKEKFSPHIMKSPKKYFGSSAKRKLIKENQNSSSTSFEAKTEGLSSVPNNESIRSRQSNDNANQKLISQYFSKSKPESNIGTKLKQSIGRENILDSKSEVPKNTNGEDNNDLQLSSTFYLRIFEDCLEHIHKVILPVEGYLLDENEKKVLNLINSLNSSKKYLYFRLLDRKHYWINRTTINYGDLNSSLSNDLGKLEELGLLTSDYNQEDIHVLLERLNIPDLKKLCHFFKVSDRGNKCSLILNLTKMTEKQSTLDGKHDSHSLIRKKLESSLNCVKLTPKPREAILKCLRICSFSYNREVEEKLVQNILNNYFKVKYPKFTVKHAVVFHNKENFDEYEKSLQLLSQVMSDKKPNNEILLELIDRARTSFEQFLSSESNRNIFKRTPDYLMRFSAANVYAGIVFHNINVLKKDKTNKKRIDEAVAFLEKLIEERIFLSKKRGPIYDALIRIYRQKKDYSKALSTFQKAREDDLIPQVIQFSLLAQMKPMLRQKAVRDQIKSKLQAICNMSSLNCNSIRSETVLAKSIPSDKPNRKKVYVTESEDSTLYQSVEELVVNNFRKRGWYGVHDEGSFLKSIIVACFWDIIFESPTLENETMSVFVSKYQMRPLDWGSRKFYLRRESAIKERLKAIENSDWRAVYNRVHDCLKNHAGESFNKSIWNWLKYENLRNIEGFLMCTSTKFIASVAEWLLQDYATYSSGLPDCTLWNRTKKKCLFVEVKSPGDTLAKHQEFWLKQIEEFGGNSLICHVKEIASCATRLSNN